MTEPEDAFHRYTGEGHAGAYGPYLADPETVIAVNTALAAQMPLLVTGAPGCGKTALAYSVATELRLGEVLPFHVRSDHLAKDALYSFDAARRFFEAQSGLSAARDARNYVQLQALGTAIASTRQRLVLIDEIDKAPRDLPNSLLNVLDQAAFTIDETGKTQVARNRPVVIITSNRERQLPDPFLRRCIYHHINFPSAERLVEILRGHGLERDLGERLIQVAVRRFMELRGEVRGWRKAPSTSELLVWCTVLQRALVSPEQLAGAALDQLPFLGALIKTQDDLRLLTGRN